MSGISSWIPVELLLMKYLLSRFLEILFCTLPQDHRITRCLTRCLVHQIFAQFQAGSFHHIIPFHLPLLLVLEDGKQVKSHFVFAKQVFKVAITHNLSVFVFRKDFLSHTLSFDRKPRELIRSLTSSLFCRQWVWLLRQIEWLSDLIHLSFFWFPGKIIRFATSTKRFFCE